MTDDSYGYDSGAGAGAIAAIGLMSVLYIALILFGIYMYMRVARKAGWTLWHGLLMLVPLANIVFMIMFVFMEWPIERRLREAEQRLALAYGGVASYGGLPTYGTPDLSTGYGSAYGAPAYGAQPWAPPSTDAAPPVPPAPQPPSPPSPGLPPAPEPPR